MNQQSTDISSVGHSKFNDTELHLCRFSGPFSTACGIAGSTGIKEVRDRRGGKDSRGFEDAFMPFDNK